ncbi:MAG: hypothetical protein DRG50_06965 [Deltaproteobacteria bacterium]|nr:MAG: hypothetical protein DRG50_06965 [Deltaproteobacteria bacterium]
MSLIEEALKKAAQRKGDDVEGSQKENINAEALLETLSPPRRRWFFWLVAFLCLGFLVFAFTVLLKLNKRGPSVPLTTHAEQKLLASSSGSEKIPMHQESSSLPASEKKGEQTNRSIGSKDVSGGEAKTKIRPPSKKVYKKVKRERRVNPKRSLSRAGFSHGKKSADKAMLDAWLKEAYMHTELGDKKRALQLYSQVLKLDPHRVEALTNRGIIYEEMGQCKLAEKDLLAALALAPADKVVLNALGVLYLNQGRLEEAKVYFQRANYAPAKVNLALIFWRQGNFGKVKEYLVAAQRLDPQNPYVYYYWGIYYRQIGDNLHAQENFDISARLAKERGVFPLLKKLEAVR